ncbi:MAG: hypothetical protein M5U28_06840 [Sandaracinaceae bacterium]|nr:hypothetical protein [Sandaracinaceae bacterium]
MLRRALALLALLAVACSPDKPVDDAPPESTVRIGAVMMETGAASRRRAARARPRAGSWPSTRSTRSSSSSRRTCRAPSCRATATTRSPIACSRISTARSSRRSARPPTTATREAFRARFARVAASCNGCHAACQVAFVEVPTEPGQTVPRLDPAAGPPE